MNVVGLLRSQSENLFRLTCLLVSLVACYVFARLFLRREDRSFRDGAVWVINRVFAALVVIVVVGMVVNIARTVFANRLPRSDVDESGVYEQQRENLNLGATP